MSGVDTIPGGTYRAEAWASGPERVYAVLAEALLDRHPGRLTGARVLDVGAGTGVVSVALRRRGAQAVAVDIEPLMLRAVPAGVARIVADGRRLPFPAGTFDGAVAAFAITHVDDPTAMLAEAARATRPGGHVLASAFPAGQDPPEKRAVDDALARHGHVPPAWYAAMKEREGWLGTSPGLGDAARRAGLVDVQVVEGRVDPGFRRAADVVAWRLGMASVAPFVAALPAAERDALVREAVAAVERCPQPGPLRLLILSSTVAA